FRSRGPGQYRPAEPPLYRHVERGAARSTRAATFFGRVPKGRVRDDRTWGGAPLAGRPAVRLVGGGRLGLLLDRVQLERAHEQLEPLRLEQDLAGRGEDVGALVDGVAVDADRDARPRAQALDPVPLARRVLDVVPAARVEQLLEVPVVLRPPELAARRR